jgi:hypothetical protein
MRPMTKALPLLLIAGTLLAGCGSGAKQVGPVPTQSPAVEATDTLPESVSTEGETSSAAGTSTEPTPTETKTEPAVPVVCKPETGGEDGVFTNLRDVRVGAHDGYDRIVFEFAPPKPNPGGQGGIPSYEIRQAKPPFTQDPSDLPLEVAGDSFIHLVMQGATGYDFDGNLTYTGPRVLTPGFGTLAQAVQGGDFEATVTWVLGLSRPTCWDVQELHDPDRLVIDFHHV